MRGFHKRRTRYKNRYTEGTWQEVYLVDFLGSIFQGFTHSYRRTFSLGSLHKLGFRRQIGLLLSYWSFFRVRRLSFYLFRSSGFRIFHRSAYVLLFIQNHHSWIITCLQFVFRFGGGKGREQKHFPSLGLPPGTGFPAKRRQGDPVHTPFPMGSRPWTLTKKRFPPFWSFYGGTENKQKEVCLSVGFPPGRLPFWSSQKRRLPSPFRWG